MLEHIGSIGSIASFIGSLTVVGSALIWVYNTFIGQPREANRQEEETIRHSRMLAVVKKENEPLTQSIKLLTEFLNKSRIERIDDHETQLDGLTDRVIVLETINKLRKFKSGTGGN